MRSKLKIVLGLTGTLAALLLVFQNCSRANFSQDLSSKTPTAVGQQGGAAAPTTTAPVTSPVTSAPSTPAPAPTPVAVCNPFGAAGSSAGHGMSGQFFYMDSVQGSQLVEPKHLMDIYPTSHKVSQTLFLPNVNIPTQAGIAGIKVGSTYLADQYGIKVTQNFGFRVGADLRLTPGQQTGWYQFAMISDDGAQLSTTYNGMGYIAGDGSNALAPQPNGPQHGTRSQCGQRAIFMDQNTVVPLDLFYYQGNQGELSAVMAWRFTGSGSPNYFSNGCNEELQGGFFQEGNAWTRMKGDGWSVIDSANLFLQNGLSNPCQ